MKSSTGRDEVLVGGILKAVRVSKSKKGDLYAQGRLEDMNGSVDILCFSESFKRLTEKLKLDVPVLVKGSVRVEEGSNPKLMISDITPLEASRSPSWRAACESRFRWRRRRPATIDALHTLCAERKGEAKVLFDLERKGDFTVVMEVGRL